VAARYLERQGLKIIERNLRRQDCEINIIVQKDRCVYFVEVKYRAQSDQGSALYYWQIRRINDLKVLTTLIKDSNISMLR